MATPLQGKDYCFWHDPETQEQAAEARRLGGLRRRKESTIVGAYEVGELDNVADLRRLLQIADARLDEDPISSWHVRLGTRTALGMFVLSLWILLVILSAEPHARPFIYFQF
jgi:hypothetical protein